ncbi:hypothetical protein T484DRAFT_3341934 [Baffinella frigidus]|nr:hypothetical protein T484DRAFT_3341934 [Cryptophyta sp. CCMP2293]
MLRPNTTAVGMISPMPRASLHAPIDRSITPVRSSTPGMSASPMEHSLSPGNTFSRSRSRSYMARSMSAEPHAMDPLEGGTIWARNRFFSRQSARIEEFNAYHEPREVMDAKHPSNQTIMSSAPSSWSISPGNKKPKSMCGGILMLPEPRNIAEIRERTRKEMDGRLLHTVTMRDRDLRTTNRIREESGEVSRLRTPDIGAKEQVIEEVLRQLQGSGPLEQLKDSLRALDREKTGMVAAEDFKRLCEANFSFAERHVQFLISISSNTDDFGTGQFKDMVMYEVILKKLNVARNR